MATSKVLRGEIRKLEDRRRETRQKIAELYEREADLTVEIDRIRVQDFLQTTDEHLRHVVWGPLSVSPQIIILEAVEISDEVDDLIHEVLGLGYHDEAPLTEGILLRVDDEVMKLLINTPQELLNFASTHHLNIRWADFREMLRKLEERKVAATQIEDELRKIIDDLQIPEDE